MPRMRSNGLSVVVLGFSALVASCGSSSNGGGTDGGGITANDFAGTWTYASGTLTPSNCSVLGIPIPPVDLSGQSVTITATDTTHFKASAGSMCNVNFTVSGSTATAASGQTCVMAISGVNVTLNVSSYMLTLANGMLTSTESGSAPIGGSSCTATGNGSLTKS